MRSEYSPLVACLLALMGFPTAGFGDPIPVVFYNMPNGHGQANNGMYNYWDLAYDGAGARTTDDAPLSNGTGDLTDGRAADDYWRNVENDEGSGPWVGWQSDLRMNPTIQFNFVDSPTINEIRLHIDNSDVGSVYQPAQYFVNGVPWSFSPLAYGTIGWVTLTGPPVTGNQLTLTLANHDFYHWIFVSEIEFDGTTSGPGVQLRSLALKASEVAGCKSVTGTVTLSSPAPEGGRVVTLSDTLAAASTPAAVTIPAGATSKSFTIKTTAVATDATGAVRATLLGTTLSQNLTVRRMGLKSLTLTPTSVVGGNSAVGKATLECTAGPGPVTVNLGSNAPAVAHPIAANVVVPQGVQSETFTVTTNPVLLKSYATIAGTANGITKSKKLTVNVAAAVSPTSLRFGNVTVGTTSGSLNATLTNRGAVPFSVTAISLTGTGAPWFAQTDNCPANLAAGASCTISVRFTPQAARASRRSSPLPRARPARR